MSTEGEFAALHKLLRPLSRKLTEELARALVGVEPDPDSQKRYHFLASKHTEGSLSSEEESELQALVRANTLLQILKLEAQLSLNNSAAA
jgi:hypothetical protein